MSEIHQHVEFLRMQIESGLQMLRESIAEMDIQFKRYRRAQRDVLAFQGALEALTRDDPDPFVSTSLPNVIFEHTAVLKEIQQKPENAVLPGLTVDGETNEPSSMADATRRLFASTNGRPVSIDDLLMEAGRFKTLHISRDYLYRLLPRLVRRGEIKRSDRGKYVWIPGNEGSLFKEE